MPREKEYHSVAEAATRIVEDVQVFDGWLQVDPPLPPVLRLDPSNSTIRVLPNGRWTESNTLTQPFIAASSHILVMVEARAHEDFCLGVQLQPQDMPFLHVTWGATGNTQTILAYRNNRCNSGISGKQKKQAIAAGRHCHSKAFTTYWMCITPQRCVVGIADQPGKHPIAMMDFEEDIVFDNGRTPVFINIANKAVQDRKLPLPLHVRNLRVTTLTQSLRETMQEMTTQHIQVIINVDQNDEETMKLMKEYEEECQKAKARAEKFGVEYNPPTADKFLPWSEARRLRANPNQGFITGIDIFDDKEREKQEARKKRFASMANSTHHNDDPQDDDKPKGEGGQADEKETLVVHQTNAHDRSINIAEAWDNWKLVGPQRMDPPMALWQQPPEDERDDMEQEGPVPQLVPEKIHIFSIDWAAFKQIRTNDIMSYFSVYGPSYVEWLGDLSCNVHFEDQFSARRALENMADVVPTSLPPEVSEGLEEGVVLPELGRMGWRLGRKMLRKISDDRYGRRGTRARMLMRLATSLDVLKERPTTWPKPPPGFSTKRILGPGRDFPSKRLSKRRATHAEATPEPTTFEDRMNQGLSSGRKGFSIEELEAERAKKRVKTDEN